MRKTKCTYQKFCRPQVVRQLDTTGEGRRHDFRNHEANGLSVHICWCAPHFSTVSYRATHREFATFSSFTFISFGFPPLYCPSVLHTFGGRACQAVPLQQWIGFILSSAYDSSTVREKANRAHKVYNFVLTDERIIPTRHICGMREAGLFLQLYTSCTRGLMYYSIGMNLIVLLAHVL